MSQCYYCGMPANGIDHVVPQSLLEVAKRMLDVDSYLELTGRGRRLEVPACQQCNSILGNKYDQNLAMRKARAKERLKTKLRNDLGIPDWDEDEIQELGPTLRQVVLEGMVRKWVAQFRLRW